MSSYFLYFLKILAHISEAINIPSPKKSKERSTSGFISPRRIAEKSVILIDAPTSTKATTHGMIPKNVPSKNPRTCT